MYLVGLYILPCCCCIIRYALFFSLVALSQSLSNHSFLFHHTCLHRTSSAICCMVLLYKSHSSCIVSPSMQGSCFRLSSSLHIYVCCILILQLGYTKFPYPLLSFSLCLIFGLSFWLSLDNDRNPHFLHYMI